jgi:hypothetical protein
MPEDHKANVYYIHFFFFLNQSQKIVWGNIWKEKIW